MVDRPILFSPPMVRALLDGTKTQTRRAINPECGDEAREGDILLSWPATAFLRQGAHFRPRYRVGDRLWVRETLECANSVAVGYPADGTWLPNTPWIWARPKLPSLFMPRWASRLTLTVTDVRVERLQDISEADAIAEGIVRENVIIDANCYGRFHSEVTADHYWNGAEPDGFEGHDCAVDAYAALWDSINGPGAWAANPWVCAISFDVQRGNIDEVQG